MSISFNLSRLYFASAVILLGCSGEPSEHREAFDEEGLTISEAEAVFESKEAEGAKKGWSEAKIGEETDKEYARQLAGVMTTQERQAVIDEMETKGRKYGWSEAQIDRAIQEKNKQIRTKRKEDYDRKH